MKKKSTISEILKEFLTRYPRQFSLLFALLVIEGLVAAMSLLAIVPLADYIIDPTLLKPSRISAVLLSGLAYVKISPSFWIFGIFFVITNLFKGGMAVVIRFGIIRIKHTVVRGLFDDALRNFFKARWAFALLK